MTSTELRCLILSHKPDSQLAQDFERFLVRQFQVDVARRPHNPPPNDAVVFLERGHEHPQDYLETARILVLYRNRVFLLNRGLGHSRDDIKPWGSLHGLEGVVYNSWEDEWGAFAINSGEAFRAEEVLKPYLVRHGGD